eukprot:evm.model.scf_2095.3 EVM.evm.TU.scf_2095.3   scf_2095:13167-18023(+)
MPSRALGTPACPQRGSADNAARPCRLMIPSRSLRLAPCHPLALPALRSRKSTISTCTAQKLEKETADGVSGNGASPLPTKEQPSAATFTIANESDSKPWKWEATDDAVRAYGAFAFVLLLGMLPAFNHLKFAELPYFVGLAALTIYIGAHRGLNAKQRQQLSLKQGAMAPFIASGVLFGGYLVIKMFPNHSLQSFINAYFWLASSTVVATASMPLLHRLGVWKGVEFDLPAWLVQTSDNEPVRASGSDALAVALGIGVATVDLVLGHSNFTLNNMLACLIAADILQNLGARSFRIAGVLLTGLLVYDVFWVFGSPKVVGDNVMMTVATSSIASGPFKLLFPKEAGGSIPYSLLGLGDVAIPGFLAALALRYDASRSVDMRARAVASADAMRQAMAAIPGDATDLQIAETMAASAEAGYDAVADREARTREASTNGAPAGHPALLTSDSVMHKRTYFLPVMAAYVGGLVMAFAANVITHLGQPALLYLVPMTLSTVGGLSLSRGEFERVWNYSDSVGAEGGKEGGEDEAAGESSRAADGNGTEE